MDGNSSGAANTARSTPPTAQPVLACPQPRAIGGPSSTFGRTYAGSSPWFNDCHRHDGRVWPSLPVVFRCIAVSLVPAMPTGNHGAGGEILAAQGLMADAKGFLLRGGEIYRSLRIAQRASNKVQRLPDRMRTSSTHSHITSLAERRIAAPSKQLRIIGNCIQFGLPYPAQKNIGTENSTAYEHKPLAD